MCAQNVQPDYAFSTSKKEQTIFCDMFLDENYTYLFIETIYHDRYVSNRLGY